MGPTGRLPVMMTNTTRRQVPYTGRLPAPVERSISRMSRADDSAAKLLSQCPPVAFRRLLLN
jgi:hypothetical protein